MSSVHSNNPNNQQLSLEEIMNALHEKYPELSREQIFTSLQQNNPSSQGIKNALDKTSNKIKQAYNKIFNRDEENTETRPEENTETQQQELSIDFPSSEKTPKENKQYTVIYLYKENCKICDKASSLVENYVSKNKNQNKVLSGKIDSSQHAQDIMRLLNNPELPALVLLTPGEPWRMLSFDDLKKANGIKDLVSSWLNSSSIWLQNTYKNIRESL